jgi:hypothetical protein
LFQKSQTGKWIKLLLPLCTNSDEKRMPNRNRGRRSFSLSFPGLIGRGTTITAFGSGRSLTLVVPRRFFHFFFVAPLLLTFAATASGCGDHQPQQRERQLPGVPELTEDEFFDVVAVARGRRGRRRGRGRRSGAAAAVIVRFDPPVRHGQTAAFDHVMAVLRQELREHDRRLGDAVGVYEADCSRVPYVCLKALGEIPPAEPVFAAWSWGGSGSSHGGGGGGEDAMEETPPQFDRYTGPRNTEDLFRWFATIVTQAQRQQPGDEHENVHGNGTARSPSSSGAGRKQTMTTTTTKTVKRKDDSSILAVEVSTDGATAKTTVEEEDAMPPGQGNSRQPARPEGRGVYIYDEPWARVLEEDCGVPNVDGMMTESAVDPGYFAVLHYLINQTREAGLVVDDPEEARWFLVPFDFDRSYALDDSCRRGASSTRTHLQRVHAVLDGLQSSRYYRRRSGRDHVASLMHFAFAPWRRQSSATGVFDPNQLLGNSYFPADRASVLQQMVIFRYISTGLKLLDDEHGEFFSDDDSRRRDYYHGFAPYRGPQGDVWWVMGEDWRCSVVLPVLTLPEIEQQAKKNLFNTTFEAWLDRPYLFHYRGHGSKKCVAGAQILHETMYALRDIFPESIINNTYADTRDEYASELIKSKFCIVLRGDDPERSRFNDAVAAGCIPVFINDGWELTVSPFPYRKHINYGSFSVFIPESMFLKHPTSSLYFSYGIPEVRLRRMHAAMLDHRPYIVWGLGEPNNRNVGRMAWEVVNEDCEFNDGYGA